MVDAGDIVRCTDSRMERITECGRTLKEQTVSKAKWRESLCMVSMAVYLFTVFIALTTV
ncbi:hypothetical protein C358_06191 [Cryptococcus neoformans MW-RSA852]|nr:hypothetical protein C358_06191 [Cryptococcus neoformans var. grubii MW-RSA852]